jgi:hypothetical protein
MSFCSKCCNMLRAGNPLTSPAANTSSDEVKLYDAFELALSDKKDQIP